MNNIFSDLMDVSIIIYLDNILIYSNNPADHKKHVCKVLHRLRENGLYAHPDKCCFSEDIVEYLGFILSKDSDKTGICIGMDMLEFRLLFSHYK